MVGPQLTSHGLKTQPQTVAVLTAAQWAGAVGSADLIQVAYDDPVTTLYEGMILGFRAAFANTTATPTFSPDGITAYTIVKGDHLPLDPGDIAGAGYEALVRFDEVNTVWELLNPFVPRRTPEWALSTGSADALVVAYTPPFGTIKQGQIIEVRANHSNATTAPTIVVDGKPARIIYKNGQLALNIGDIPITHDALLSYHDDATPWWELLNPAVGAQAGTFALAGGTVNVITAAFSPAHTALTDGDRVTVRMAGINTIAEVTFNPDALGALRVYRAGKVALFVNDLRDNHDAELVFHDDTIDWWELVNPIGGVQVAEITSDDATATDVNTALAWFGSTQDEVTLGNAGEYEFEGYLRLSRSAGTTSHTTGIKFGGTASFDRFNYFTEANNNDDLSLAAPVIGVGTSASGTTTAKAASTSATEQTMIRIRGRCKVAAAGGGTLIPQFILSAAAGGISTRKVGTFFRIWPSPQQGTFA